MQAYATAETARLLDRLEQDFRRASGQSDPGAVHDVRVAIRRFTQALRVFAPLLPAKPVKKIRKRLGRALDAAAAVRDLDIALELLAEARLGQSHSLWEETRARRYAADLAFRAELDRVSVVGRLAGWRTKLRLAPEAAP
jgi:CHAD domain-containing protein